MRWQILRLENQLDMMCTLLMRAMKGLGTDEVFRTRITTCYL